MESQNLVNVIVVTHELLMITVKTGKTVDCDTRVVLRGETRVVESDQCNNIKPLILAVYY